MYTTYFANIKNLPSGVIPIAICGRPPREWQGIVYKRLAPKIEFFKVWRETRDNDYYIREFNSQVLNRLNAESVMMELKLLARGRDFALVCYEKPNDFCHRHLVAKWFRENGYNIEEFVI